MSGPSLDCLMSEADQSQGGREEIWLEKYRPQTLPEIAGQEAIVERLRHYVATDDVPNMLFAGPAGIGKCVTGETPVLTDSGLTRIDTLVGDTDGFRDVTDTQVLSFTQSGTFEYTEPSHAFAREADTLLDVSTRDGADATVTPEHRFLVLGHDGFEWREATALEEGDRLVRPLSAPLSPTDTTLDWVGEMDGDCTFVHVTEEFAREHEIPFEENLVGTKKSVVEGLRTGETVEEMESRLGAPRKTINAAVREFQNAELETPSSICSLAYLRSLDVSRDALRAHVGGVQHVAPTNNRRSAVITPPWELTPELAELVGLAISEARIERGRVRFYNTEDRLLDRFERLLGDLFDVDPDRGVQQDVPYVVVHNRTVVHYLESCFDVFRSARGGDGIGSTLLRADAGSRRAFLRAVFDSEAHITPSGVIEMTQKNEDHITLCSYLLAGFGIPSRRKRKTSTATNSSGPEREYHALYISGAPHLERFRTEVGFSIDRKAGRLADNAGQTGNPNNDTIPTQEAVDTLSQRLNMTKQTYIPETLNPGTPGRERYLRGVSELVDAATERLEAVQEAYETLVQLRPGIADTASVPATWAGTRAELEPVEVRRTVTEETDIRTDTLLEYARGNRIPYACRTQEVLASMGHEPSPVSSIQDSLADIVRQLDISYSNLADDTQLRGTDIGNLLHNDDHSIASLPRFETVADRLESRLSRMASTETLRALRTLHLLDESELYFDEVSSVERVDDGGRVYDLTVPETRNYVAGRLPTVMHNTTSAIATARELYGDDWEEHFLELNASDERGIDVIRDRVKSFARTAFGGANYRIIFLDEADALCVPPGTKVVAGDPSSPEIKPIEEVDTDGEPMPSVDFETNEIQSDRGTLVDSGVADFFELELADGRTVVASLSHPFFTIGDDRALVEKELQELRPGDEIAEFKDDVGVSQCAVCGAWTAGRFCSLECKSEGYSREMQGETDEFEPAPVLDGGRKAVQTVEISQIEYSHRGKAYNISMEGTPNFMLANGILTHNTSDAQAALRRTMEQFSNNVRFILSCNYSSQIIDPIQSRCAVFRFSPLSEEAVEQQVRQIAEQEGIQLTDDGVDALVYVAGGDMRAAINGLQAAAVTDGAVDEAAVFEITSTARPEDIEEMVTRALDGDFTAARSQLDRLLTEEGIAGGDVIDQLHRSVWEFDLGDAAAVRLLDRIGEADYRITEGANERIQLEALLASVALDETGGRQ